MLSVLCLLPFLALFCYTSLITPNSHPHEAFYDDDGNIVIPGTTPDHGETVPVVERELVMEEPLLEEECREEVTKEPLRDVPTMTTTELIVWDTLEDSPVESAVIQEERSDVRQRFQILSTRAEAKVSEGLRQYEVSARNTSSLFQDITRGLRSASGSAWKFLTQPVVIPGKSNTVKQYRRGSLFLIDVVRFGGTFAGIFGVLFVALNYQSFYQIAAAKVLPLIEPTSMDTSVGDTATPGAAGPSAVFNSDTRGLLAYLPDVGPPIDVLIIPKLNVYAPIQNASTDALMRQDWTQVEKDIQKALEDGVVHYPGTAKPGQAGRAFITGHSSYYPLLPGHYKNVFARLTEMKVGDEYWIYYNGDRHRYIVRSTKQVSPSDVSVLDQPTDERLGTLMTCTPTGTSLYRWIVDAQEVDPDTGVALKVGEHTEHAPVSLGLDTLPI